MTFLSYLISGISLGQRLRNHRAGVHDGLRHRKDAELRARRRHHGRRIHILLYDELSRPVAARIRPAGHRGLYGSGHRHRASGLQTAASGAPRWPS